MVGDGREPTTTTQQYKPSKVGANDSSDTLEEAHLTIFSRR